MTQIAGRYVVSGRVQGVFFRASTQQRAQQLRLAGWVRNLPDGRVEVYACGETAQLDSLCDWLHQGPELARVDSVQSFSCEPEGLGGFTIR